MYCPVSFLDLTLEGVRNGKVYSYFEISLERCTGNTTCFDQAVVDTWIIGKSLRVAFINSDFS